MAGKEIASTLRRFDAYPKTLEDFRIKTFGGAAVTIISSVLMFVLFLSEFNYYLTTEVVPELFVDTTRGQKLRINVDATFPRLACNFMTIDSMDVSGDQQIDVDHNIFKQRLKLDGSPFPEAPEKEDLGQAGDSTERPPGTTLPPKLDPNRCESCYGAESKTIKCCNTCEQVREAYRQKGWALKDADEIEQCKREGYTDKVKAQMNEGCRVYGYLEVNKVAGNFHFAPGKSFQQHHIHVHDTQAFAGQKINVSHKITHLSFGQDYPGIVNPLDVTEWNTDQNSVMFQYFVKIVPTTYEKVNGDILYTNQYSVTKNMKSAAAGSQSLPGVFIMYELSPMMVKYTEKHRSFMHFLTGVCAIIGGIFTVAGLIDSFIYHGSRVIQKKIEIGKQT